MAKTPAVKRDARTSKRFALALPIKVSGAKSAKQLKGITQDLSAAGVFISADADFSIGSKVEFDLTLPAEAIASDKDVHIHCRGRVVRKDTRGKGKGKARGLACIIDDYEFIRT